MIKKRHTKQKDFVINYLKENIDKHLTAEELFVALKKEKLNISQATVYRTLASLEQEGYIRKYITSDNKCACYQYVDNENNCNLHYHLMCDKCGKVMHFESEQIKELKNNLLNIEKFDLNLQKIVFYGKCKNCKDSRG